MRTSWLLVAAGLVTTPAVADDDKATASKIKSGCQPGELVAPFEVADITGRFKKTKSVCYV